MLAQLMSRLGYLNSLREWNHSLYEHLYYTLEIKKMSNICGFDKILKTECNLQNFTRNCGIKNLDNFERDNTGAHLWRAGLLNVKENVMTIYCIVNRCLVWFSKARKVNAVEYWWNIVAKLKVKKWSFSKWLSNLKP